jgi:hypothetical protein
MIRRALILASLVVAVAAQAQAQTSGSAQTQARFEVSALGGYTFSTGVSGDPYVTPSGTFTGISVASGPSFGASFGVLTASGGEAGFEWGRQLSTLGVKGLPSFDIGDMNVDQYHAYFAYNALAGAKTRPYISIGIGATHYNAVPYSAGSQSGEIPGATRFSFKLGLGFKSWTSEGVGFRAGIQWTPTFIASQDVGWWCDPYWGCYTFSQAKISHQFEMSGGVVFRFGGQ